MERRGHRGSASVGVGFHLLCAAGSMQRGAWQTALGAQVGGWFLWDPRPHTIAGGTLHRTSPFSQPILEIRPAEPLRDSYWGFPRRGGGESTALASGSPVWNSEGFCQETRKEAGDLEERGALDHLRRDENISPPGLFSAARVPKSLLGRLCTPGFVWG